MSSWTSWICSTETRARPGGQWQNHPASVSKVCRACNAKVVAPAVEEHRLKLRELVKQKIKELEFKVALELRIRC